MTKQTIHYDILGTEAPKCPETLPRILHQMVENAPEHMKPAILNSAFPALGALMHNVKFRYPDNVCHEPHFNKNAKKTKVVATITTTFVFYYLYSYRRPFCP